MRTLTYIIGIDRNDVSRAPEDLVIYINRKIVDRLHRFLQEYLLCDIWDRARHSSDRWIFSPMMFMMLPRFTMILVYFHDKTFNSGQDYVYFCTHYQILLTVALQNTKIAKFEFRGISSTSTAQKLCLISDFVVVDVLRWDAAIMNHIKKCLRVFVLHF